MQYWSEVTWQFLWMYGRLRGCTRWSGTSLVARSTWFPFLKSLAQLIKLRLSFTGIVYARLFCVQNSTTHILLYPISCLPFPTLQTPLNASTADAFWKDCGKRRICSYMCTFMRINICLNYSLLIFYYFVKTALKDKQAHVNNKGDSIFTTTDG